MAKHIFNGKIEHLRRPERLRRAQLDRLTALCLDGIEAASALDIGTGSALFAEAFATQGLDVAGVDINPAMIEAARQHVPGGAFLVASAHALPYPDNAFDIVFFGLVLHEVDDPLAALTEARRVARQRVAVLEWPYDAETDPPRDHRLKADLIEAFAREAGFQAIDTTPLRRLALYRMTV